MESSALNVRQRANENDTIDFHLWPRRASGLPFTSPIFFKVAFADSMECRKENIFNKRKKSVLVGL